MIRQLVIIVILSCFSLISNAQWQQLNSFAANGNAKFMVVINDTLIVSHCGNAYDMTEGIFISSDYGNTWTAKNSSLGIGADPLINDGSYLYAGTWGPGVKLSTDKGISWTSKNNGLPASFPVLDLVAKGSVLYTCGTGGVFRSLDSANTWTNVSYPGTTQGRTIFFVGDTVISNFVTIDSALTCISIDKGVHWTVLDSSSGLTTGIPNAPVILNKIVLINNRIYAIGGGGHFFMSSDYGFNWTAGSGLNGYSCYDIVNHYDTLYIAGVNGVYKSVDFGLTWVNIGIDNVMSLAIVGDTLFAGTGYKGIWKYALPKNSTDIKATSQNSVFTIYPNPANNKLNISGLKNNTELLASIYNTQGQLVLKKTINHGKASIDITSLSKGVYYIQITQNDRISTSSFIKN